MYADGVRAGGRSEGDSSKVSEEGDRAIRFRSRAEELSGCEIFESIGEEVGMRISKDERSEFGDGNESAFFISHVSHCSSETTNRLRLRISRSGYRPFITPLK